MDFEHYICLPDYRVVGMFSVSYNLRITFDMPLTLTARVVNMSRTAQFESVVSAQYAITS